MANIDIIQYDFSHGELSQKMISRSDLEIYRKSAKTLRNVLMIPQGGLRKRFGTDYITRSITTNENAVQGTEYKYNSIKRFLVLFFDTVIKIYLDDVLKATITSTPYTADMLVSNSVKFVHLQDRLVICGDGTVPVKDLKRGVDDVTWTLTDSVFKNLPTYDFKKNYDNITFTLSNVDIGTGRILTASAPLFDANYIGGRFVSIGDASITEQNGVANITGYTDSTHVTVEITSQFDSSLTTGITGKNCDLEETAWNSTYGYPTCCCYYEGRLFFANTPSLQSTIFGSCTEDSFNFDLGRGLDSDAILATLDGYNIIENIVGDVTLQIFTDENELATLQLDGQALKPNMSVRKQSGNGSVNVIPAVLDNQTLYVKKGGKGVMAFSYNDSGTRYVSNEISLLNPELIRNPISMAIFKGSELEEANYLFIINEDGTLTVYHTLQQQNISGLTLCDLSGEDTTGGDDPKFKRVISVGDQIYFIVYRVVNGSNYLYLEKLNFNHYTDCTILKTLSPASTLVTGLDALEGLTVKVFADGYLLADKTVQGGEITIEKEATNIIVGLFYVPYIEPLPFDINFQTGNTMYQNKRIVEIIIQYYESLGIYIGNELIPYRQFNEILNYPPPEPDSGYYVVNNMGGWEARQTFFITQRDPLPMTILNFGIKMGI